MHFNALDGDINNVGEMGVYLARSSLRMSFKDSFGSAVGVSGQTAEERLDRALVDLLKMFQGNFEELDQLMKGQLFIPLTNVEEASVVPA